MYSILLWLIVETQIYKSLIKCITVDVDESKLEELTWHAKHSILWIDHKMWTKKIILLFLVSGQGKKKRWEFKNINSCPRYHLEWYAVRCVATTWTEWTIGMNIECIFELEARGERLFFVFGCNQETIAAVGYNQWKQSSYIFFKRLYIYKLYIQVIFQEH